MKGFTVVNLALLCRRERDIRGRQAFPQLFDELQALIDGQAVDVQWRDTHATKHRIDSVTRNRSIDV